MCAMSELTSDVLAHISGGIGVGGLASFAAGIAMSKLNPDTNICVDNIFTAVTASPGFWVPVDGCGW
jgi:hypothetical protein